MPFAALDLHPALVRGIGDLGFTRPTSIQSDAIPAAMAGRDILACAATGSGKTAAFLLPILHGLLARPRGTTRALVLAPTRELALQIVDDLQAFAAHTDIDAAAVHGGVAMGPQERAFRRGADVIVATPGRLLDHFRHAYARLEGLEYLVLDEADRMLDMGFVPDIRRILAHVPTPKQTLLFSATMPPAIRKLTEEILRDPERINLQRKSAPAAGVAQAVYPVAQELKSALLLELLKGGAIRDALVFTRTKHRANRLAQYLNRNKVPTERIHGNRSQAQRTKALAGFKNGDFRVLVATDIAARGIDVEALGHVVNFDVPGAPEDYIHRVGRTARAEATGDAFTFVSPAESSELAGIERAVGRPLPRVTLPGFDYGARPEGRLEVPIAERVAAIRASRSGKGGGRGAQAKGRGAGDARGNGANGTNESEQRRAPGRSRSSRRSRRR